MTKKQNKSPAKIGAMAKDQQRAANPKTLMMVGKKGEPDSRAQSKAVASPTINAAVTVFNFHPMTEGANITDLVDELGKQALTVRDGCMDRPEAMLVAQAHALDAIFTAMSHKAAMNMSAGYLPATETYLRMALKAQSQCRSTLEALSEIKNPRAPTFIKQQNVAQQQQVNNGQGTTNGSRHAHEQNINPSNELLEVNDGERLDIGAEGQAGGADTEMATLGAIDRAKNGSWKACK